MRGVDSGTLHSERETMIVDVLARIERLFARLPMLTGFTVQGRRRNGRVAEVLERVRLVRDARRDRIELGALRKAVGIARGDLVGLALGEVREACAAQLFLAFLPVGERDVVRSGLVFADHI